MKLYGREDPGYLVSAGLTALLILILTATGCGEGSGPAPTIKVGLGEAVITPRGNVQMRGFARSQVATGVHDDLHARSIVIEGEDGTTVVMLTISIVGFGREYVERIRDVINEKTGIPVENILVSVTHTHAGPNVDAAGEDYQNFLVEHAAGSAVEAWNARVPARIGVGSARVNELGRNRRRLLYGGLHPDPEVGIIRIEDAAGTLMGVAFNYGCHPSALDWQNTLYSEDWAYYAIKGIKEEIGETVWVAYFQGAEGNINVGYSAELSAVGADMPIRNYEYIEIKGGQMTDAVIDALPSITTSGDPDIATAIGMFDYPLRETFPISLEQAEREAAAAQKALDSLEGRTDLEGTRILDKVRVDVFQTGQRLRTARRFYSSDDHGGVTTVEQQAIRIGDAVFVSLPGEVFAEIGLKIKESSPFDKTFLVGLTNGYGGYLPSAAEFIEGDYEVDGSRYSDKTEQACIDASLELIRRVE